MRVSAAVVAIAGMAALLAADIPTVDAKDGYTSRTRQRAWGSGLERNPWEYPNCIVWSTRLKSFVWVCGPPYPTEMPHR